MGIFMTRIVFAVPVAFRMARLSVALQFAGHGDIEVAEARADCVHRIYRDTDRNVRETGCELGSQNAGLMIQRQMRVATKVTGHILPVRHRAVIDSD